MQNTKKQGGIVLLLLLVLAPSCYAVEVGDRQVVIDTLIGEAVGEGPGGMEAVACVIRNRSERSGRTMSQECLRPYQFSFWNDKAHVRRFLAKEATPQAQKQALNALQGALNGSRAVGTSRHYYASYMKNPPVWAKSGSGVIVIGRHVFVEGVA